MTESSSTGNEPGTETEYEPGQDNVQILGLDIHNPVFAISALTIIAFVFFSLVFQDQASAFFGWLRPALTSQFDWVFMIACNIFVLFSLFLVVSPYGKIRLGGDDAKPDYSYAGWFSMLFAAGMGIGLVFWGVAEPISHYGASLGGTALGEDGLRSDWAPLGAAAGNAEGAREMAMAATIFHWGLHPWAIYAVVALALAFFSFNKGLPLTMRSVFYPIFGKATWGPLGHIIDVLAVFATIFGLATSLGLGATQALAGLNYLFDVPVSDGMKVLLIIVITGLALISVVAGLDKGVKRLSEANMILAAALLVLVIVVGPTLAIISGFFTNLVDYVVYLPELSNWVGREDTNFMQGWTTFYWAWWIAFAPFVGLFLARISKGRTIREFVLGAMIVPSLMCFVWFSWAGGTAIDLTLNGGAGDAIFSVGDGDKIFAMVIYMLGDKLGWAMSVLIVVLLLTYLVTTADSAVLIVNTINAAGDEGPKARPHIYFWGIALGGVVGALLIAGGPGGGGLKAIQTAMVIGAFPFSAVMVLQCVALVKAVLNDTRREKEGVATTTGEISVGIAELRN